MTGGARRVRLAVLLLAAGLGACGERTASADTARDTTLVAPPPTPTGGVALPSPDSVSFEGASAGATAASVPPDSVENASRGPTGPTPLPMPRP